MYECGSRGSYQTSMNVGRDGFHVKPYVEPYESYCRNSSSRSDRNQYQYRCTHELRSNNPSSSKNKPTSTGSRQSKQHSGCGVLEQRERNKIQPKRNRHEQKPLQPTSRHNTHANPNHPQHRNRSSNRNDSRNKLLSLRQEPTSRRQTSSRDTDTPESPSFSWTSFAMTQATEQPKRVWKSAVDPKSGRTYYYDAVTRETQWRKPLELASPSERAAMAMKEKKQKDFFAAMEANILNSMAAGVVPGTPRIGSGEVEEVAPLKRVSTKGVPKPIGLVRTISSMDDALLAELTKTNPLDPSPTSTIPGPADATPAQQRFSLGRNETLNDRRGSESSFDDIPVSEEQCRQLEQLRIVADEMARASQTESSLSSSASEVAAAVTSEGLASESVSTPSTTPPKPGQLKNLAKPNLAKRNTCGTMYVGSTMSAPDKDATIKCICGVYRAHMLQSAREEEASGRGSAIRFDEYEIFNDHPDARKSISSSSASVVVPSSPKKSVIVGGSGSATSAIETLSLESLESAVPSLDEITNFYRDVFRRSQMESDCIIMSLIYVERLIKATNGGVRPRVGNWRSILFSSMIMSSKVWDDLSMWNADFSQTCPAGVTFPLARINELEIAMLSCLKYDVKVLASEYAKYYFLLRAMLIRSGLAGEDLSTMSPLDLEGAKKLEHVSTNFQANVRMKGEVSALNSKRSKSLSEVQDQISSSSSIDENSPRREMGKTNGGRRLSPTTGNAKVSLEHIVQM